MTLDLASWIRAASGALFVLLGLGCLAVSRRKQRPMLVGVVMSSIGAVVVLRNVGVTAALPGAVLDTGLLLLSGAAGVALAVGLPDRLRREEWPTVVWGLVLAVVADALPLVPFTARGAAKLAGVPASLGSWSLPIAILDLAGFVGLYMLLFVPALRMARVPPTSCDGLRGTIAIGSAFGTYIVFAAPSAGDPNAWVTLAATLILAVVPSACWLVAADRMKDRLTVALALSMPALTLLAALYRLAPANDASSLSAVLGDPYGMNGVVRVLGWTLLVYAIVRWDALGVPLPRLAASRGALAAGALATLFIVAQIAQNFLAAQYGLLMGGIVAGAFLFAASPLQRAMESLRERPLRTRAPDITPVASNASIEAYRSAVRAALEDGTMTRREEEHLAEVAHHLALSPRDALRVRREVEAELDGGAR